MDDKVKESLENILEVSSTPEITIDILTQLTYIPHLLHHGDISIPNIGLQYSRTTIRKYVKLLTSVELVRKREFPGINLYQVYEDKISIKDALGLTELSYKALNILISEGSQETSAYISKHIECSENETYDILHKLAKKGYVNQDTTEPSHKFSVDTKNEEKIWNNIHKFYEQFQIT